MAIYVTVTESMASVTFPMIPDESVATLKQRWGAASEHKVAHYVFRTSAGRAMHDEAAIQDFVQQPDSGALEVFAEELASVEFSVIGFPDAQCRLHVDLSSTSSTLPSAVCSALKIPARPLRLMVGSHALKISEPLANQGVLPLSHLSVDLLFRVTLTTRWVPSEEEEEEAEIFGGEPASALLDPHIPTGQQRLLFGNTPLPTEGSVAGALREHGGLTEVDWTLRLERQMVVHVRYPPPRARTEEVLVWPTDAVRRVLPSGASEEPPRVMTEGAELDASRCFAEQGLGPGAHLWIGSLIALRVEDSGGTQRVLRIADTATVAELRRRVAEWEASTRFHLTFDGAQLAPESRCLRRCGLADGELVRLTPRKIPVLLLYKGARYALGPINEEADLDELLVAASRAIGSALDVDCVFECSHCLRAVSIATPAQRQMSAACCREQPRLLRIHEASRLDLELHLEDADVTLRPPAALVQGLVSFIDAHAFRGWDVRDVGAIRMSVRVSVENGEALNGPSSSPELPQQERSLRLNNETRSRWWSPGSWMRRDGQRAGVQRVSAGVRMDEARASSSSQQDDSLDGAKPRTVSFSRDQPPRRPLLLSLPPFTGLSEVAEACNPTALLPNGATPLFTAARAGDAALVRSLLDRGANVDATCFSGATALHVASMRGDGAVLRLLLEAGANPETVLANGGTPLLIAAEQSQVESVRQLLNAGAAVDSSLASGVTPLYLAAERGCGPIAALLLSHGAIVNAARTTGATPIFVAAQNGRLEMMRQLMEAGARLDAAMAHGATPLYVAAQNGHLDIVKFLVSHMANVNAKMNAGATPLYVAAQNGHTEVTAFLVDNGANVNVRGDDGTTPLFIAAQNGHTRMVELLLHAGAEVNSLSDCPASPLFIAAQNGHEEVVAALIAHGADIEADSLDGSTPLYVSAQNGHAPVVRRLLNAGAKPNKARQDGTTPLRIANQLRHRAVVSLLEQHVSRAQSICVVQ